MNGVSRANPFKGEEDHSILAVRSQHHQEKTTEKAEKTGSRAIPRILWQATPRLLDTRPEPEASTPGTSQRYQAAEKDRRGVTEETGNRPEERKDSGRNSSCLASPPQRRQTTLHQKWGEHF